MSSISKYFKEYEVSKSNTATRLGIDNEPSDEVMARATILATSVLDPIREQFGPLSPQSWYRSEALERAITWNSGFRRWCANRVITRSESAWVEYFARKSHPKGEAADIELPTVDNEALYNWIRDSKLVFDQLILECHTSGNPRSGWVHVSCRASNNRMQAFVYQG